MTRRLFDGNNFSTRLPSLWVKTGRGFIVAACIAVCALAQTLAQPPPTESSSAIYKIIYAVTAKFGGNFGKARNAVPGNTGK